MKRWLVLFAALMSNVSGCMYYAYPTVALISEVPVATPEGNVHAFRVDVDHTHRKPRPPLTQYTLAKIKISERGVVPSQLEIAPATGVYNPLGVVDGALHERSEYTMLVRLYRPGYHTQSVKAWDKSRELHWAPAADLLAQEKAIDDLLAIPAVAGEPLKGTWWDLRDDKTGHSLQPGGVSAGQAETLRFASLEYDRLAKGKEAGAANMQAVRDRLRSKSQWLRTYADRPAATQ